MILEDVLRHFHIDGEFPDYLMNQTFNEVFLNGNLTKEGNAYKIEITTRQDVTHQMILRPDDEYPVVIMSRLPNGSQNGMKFGLEKDDVIYISEF